MQRTASLVIQTRNSRDSRRRALDFPNCQMAKTSIIGTEGSSQRSVQDAAPLPCTLSMTRSAEIRDREYAFNFSISPITHESISS